MPILPHFQTRWHTCFHDTFWCYSFLWQLKCHILNIVYLCLYFPFDSRSFCILLSFSKKRFWLYWFYFLKNFYFISIIIIYLFFIFLTSCLLFFTFKFSNINIYINTFPVPAFNMFFLYFIFFTFEYFLIFIIICSLILR